MQALGFFVCDQDLEDELIRAIGVTDVEQLIAAAMRDAITKVEETSRNKMSELFAKMGLPANFNLPFMPGGNG